jgi:hypothetical protein
MLEPASGGAAERQPSRQAGQSHSLHLCGHAMSTCEVPVISSLRVEATPDCREEHMVSALPKAPARTRRAAAPVRSSLITADAARACRKCRRSRWPRAAVCLSQPFCWTPCSMCACGQPTDPSIGKGLLYAALLLVADGSQQLRYGKHLDRPSRCDRPGKACICMCCARPQASIVAGLPVLRHRCPLIQRA